jgi:hypothetical protein
MIKKIVDERNWSKFENKFPPYSPEHKYAEGMHAFFQLRNISVPQQVQLFDLDCYSHAVGSRVQNFYLEHMSN